MSKKRKILVALWWIFSIGWSGMMIFVYMLGAGMSVAQSNVEIGFFAYWFAPILVPFIIYKWYWRKR
jgi:urea transporter